MYILSDHNIVVSVNIKGQQDCYFNMKGMSGAVTTNVSTCNARAIFNIRCVNK